MDEKAITIIINIVLIIFGAIQLIFLKTQKQHTRIALTEQYRSLWNDIKSNWGKLIFISREGGEYYQILDRASVNHLIELTNKKEKDGPTIWALESAQKVFGMLGEVSTRVLQGHLKIEDIYPIFGTGFLRQSRPLRQLLEPEYPSGYFSNETTKQHKQIKTEIQDWLVYHDGLRRRCLILIDLLWAEAARLEDLPPSDMLSAADAKVITGRYNRQRIFTETIRLNGIMYLLQAIALSRFLKNAEYSSATNLRGISKQRLTMLNEEWTIRLIRDRFK